MALPLTIGWKIALNRSSTRQYPTSIEASAA
jgi:hypothetical protein